MKYIKKGGHGGSRKRTTIAEVVEYVTISDLNKKLKKTRDLLVASTCASLNISTDELKTLMSTGVMPPKFMDIVLKYQELEGTFNNLAHLEFNRKQLLYVNDLLENVAKA
jgi:hypothetical protein